MAQAGVAASGGRSGKGGWRMLERRIEDVHGGDGKEEDFFTMMRMITAGERAWNMLGK